MGAKMQKVVGDVIGQAAQPGGTEQAHANVHQSTGSAVGMFMFDIDGALLDSANLDGSTPEGAKQQKQVARQRAIGVLAPRLKAIRDAGVSAGVVASSRNLTAPEERLDDCGIRQLFDGPLLLVPSGKDKASCIEAAVAGAKEGVLRRFQCQGGLARITLVDGDSEELRKASAKGIRTAQAPSKGGGGLRDRDLDALISAVTKHKRASTLNLLG